MAEVVPIWWTLDEVAQRAQVTRRTVERWVASGDLAVVKLGPRTTRVTPAALADLEIRRTRRATETSRDRRKRLRGQVAS